MTFLNAIINWCNTASDYFYEIYLDVYYWVAPFNATAPFFYEICLVFNGLAWQFSYFNDWVVDAVNRLNTILNWDAIRSYILGWLPNLQSVSTWFTNWWNEVTSVIASWWNTTQYTVQGWIDTAKQYLQTQINSLNTWVTSLEADVSELLSQMPSINEILAWFSNWWANILVKVQEWWNDTLPDVNALIDSTLRDWFPFYNDLVALWNDIKLFFTDPLEWLYVKMDDWFERFW